MWNIILLLFRLIDRHLERRELTTVERREAQRQSHLARTVLARPRRRADRKVRLTGVSQAPRRLPRLHCLRASSAKPIMSRTRSIAPRDRVGMWRLLAFEDKRGQAFGIIPAFAGTTM